MLVSETRGGRAVCEPQPNQGRTDPHRQRGRDLDHGPLVCAATGGATASRSTAATNLASDQMETSRARPRGAASGSISTSKRGLNGRSREGTPPPAAPLTRPSGPAPPRARPSRSTRGWRTSPSRPLDAEGRGRGAGERQRGAASADRRCGGRERGQEQNVGDYSFSPDQPEAPLNSGFPPAVTVGQVSGIHPVRGVDTRDRVAGLA